VAKSEKHYRKKIWAEGINQGLCYTDVMTVRAQFDQYELVIRQQAARIAELEAEVERLQAAGGAHSVLKNIYLDRNLPESLRAKAAIGAIDREVPKLLPERAPLELQAEPVETLFEQADRRMRKQLPLQGQEIEVQPNGQVIVLKPGRGNGNGEDSNN
jgi:hypothetical protein